MDNITHSLTGALTAKFIESRSTAPEEKAVLRKTFFWLFVIAANLPDIDAFFSIGRDQFAMIRQHRGITHSILFAPVLALLPALTFKFLGKVKNLRLLWLISLLGIFLHIFFDLVTSFGTRVLLPVSEVRYALDWLFIIDPFFTILMVAFLLTGRWVPRRRALVTSLGIASVVLYVLIAAFNQTIAAIRVQEAVRKEGVTWSKISTLPQPLSLFRWQGLIQTDDAVLQTYFSLFDDDPPRFRIYTQHQDSFVEKAEKEGSLRSFLGFARHPWVQSFEENGMHIVEFRDLMFSVDESLTRAFGFDEQFTPFMLRYAFDREGKLVEVTFDGEQIER